MFLPIVKLYCSESFFPKGTLSLRKRSWEYMCNLVLFLIQAVFDPEVFFYALLPPIIFFAGYDMKKVSI